MKKTIKQKPIPDIALNLGDCLAGKAGFLEREKMQRNENAYQTIEMQKANILQDSANKLQLKMIAEIKKNNEVTSAHNKAIRLLTIAIVVVGILNVATIVLSIFYNN